jgi:uncharacterized membrane protein
MYRRILAELPNIKFNENPFNRSRVVMCVQTDRQTRGWMDGAILVCALQISNALKNISRSIACCFLSARNLVSRIKERTQIEGI